MEKVTNFHELEVYKLSREMAREIFDLTKKFPKEEMYSLTDQMRKSSRSVGAQIFEAWAKRKYPKHFVSKLTDTAVDSSYLSTKTADELLERYASIGSMIYSMIKKSKWFGT